MKHIGSLLEMAYNELIISPSQELAETGEFVKRFRKYLRGMPAGDTMQWEDMSFEACSLIEAETKRADGAEALIKEDRKASLQSIDEHLLKIKQLQKELAEAKK